MNNLLLTTLEKYKKYILNVKNKISQYGGTGETHNTHKMLKKISDMTNAIGEINISENINSTREKLNDFEKNIDEYISQINLINTNNVDKIETVNLNYEIINEKLKNLSSTITSIIDTHTFHPSIFPKVGIIQIDKNDGYDKILSLFKVILHDYNVQILKLQQTHLDKPVNLNDVYNEINLSLIKNIEFSKSLISKLEFTNEELENKINFNLGEYDKNEIVTTDEDIYNYTKRLSISDTSIHISTGKIDSLLDICSHLVKSLDVENEMKFMDTEILDIDIDISAEIGKLKNDNSLTKQNIDEKLVGGFKFNSKIIANVHNDFVKLTLNIDKCNELLEKFYNLLIKYKIFKVQYNNFVMYLMLTITSNKFTDKLIPYTHLNKGLVQFYLSIVDKLLDDINQNKTKPYTLYFFQNHYLTLTEMKKFLYFLVENIKTLDVINISQCKGNVKKSFAIFNYFKDILDSYNEISEQNKINVYARINDWGDGLLTSQKMFTRDPVNTKFLNVNKSMCSLLGDGITRIKFTEVFDSENFTSNNNITKYMTLETQLSKKKGVMLITYGYSGTGKTFTLFGSSKVSKQGMLQATLNNIRGLEEVRFRVTELYGFGVQYPHYWKSNVNQNLIKYKLNITSSNEINIIGSPIFDKNIVSSFNDTYENFISLKQDKVEKVFKNFDNFIAKLDTIRHEAGRIRVTANNPDSSRSIVIYEFHLLIENTYVPFIIIDLPGREEIVETYRNNYLKNAQINIHTDFHQALLTSMSVNPLGIALLTPSLVINTFNKLKDSDKNKILGYLEQTGSTLDNENIALDENFVKLGHLMSIKQTQNGLEGFNMIKNETCPKTTPQCQNSIVDLPKKDNHTLTFGEHGGQVPSTINSIQYQGVLALFIINRFILTGNFEALGKLYDLIEETYFKTQNISNLKIHLAPFEGIYINENIIGLIKVLAKNIQQQSDDYILNHLMNIQDSSLDFETQKKILRTINFDLYTQQKKTDSEQYENIYRSKSELKKMQHSTYSPQKIYEYDNPFIKSIIDVYTTPRHVNGIELKEVSFFKLFYLFTNTQMEKKCDHQWKLLSETLSFINTVTDSNIQ
jgi:hypothetical protein